jgi:8-oxo-dGTP diphosphatase
MRPVEAPTRFVPNEEVDEIAWLPLDDALGRLSYDHDRELVTALRV